MEMNKYFGNMSQINLFTSLDISNILNVPPLCFVRVVEPNVDVGKTNPPPDFPGINVRKGTNQTGSFLIFYFGSSRVQVSIITNRCLIGFFFVKLERSSQPGCRSTQECHREVLGVPPVITFL